MLHITYKYITIKTWMGRIYMLLGMEGEGARGGL